jgi:hypothetical protein
MTNTEITYIINEELKNAGFNTTFTRNGIWVYLNRRINITEVEIALDYLVPRRHMMNHNGSVIINTARLQKELS